MEISIGANTGGWYVLFSNNSSSTVNINTKLICTGPLRIYRVPSSGVSFLNSGSLLHPILQRSQCWCVDGEATFVLRVREGSYYRIELPFANADDKEKVEDFQSVLKTILHYERTPSPFSSEYSELPERPQTPPRRPSLHHQPAKKWRLKGRWEPEDAEHRANWSPATPPRTVSPLKAVETVLEPPESVASEDSAHMDGSTEDEDTITDGTATSEEGDPAPLLDDRSGSPSPSPRPITLPFRPRPAQPRSVTAPPPLALQTTPAPCLTPLPRTIAQDTNGLNKTLSQDTDTLSITSSRDSFYSVEEPPSPSMDAASFHSLATEDDHITEQFASIKAPAHKRQTSELTIIPDTPTPLRSSPNSSPLQNFHTSDPDTPTLIPDSDDSDSVDDLPWADAVTPPDTLRMRRILHHPAAPSQRINRSLDPASRPVNLFSTPAAPSRPKLLTAALVQRAYALLIGPPAHLVALMLEIAAKIINGIPVMYDTRGRRQRLPGSWEESSADEEDEWDEDDFGIPLDSFRRTSASSNGNSSGVD
jgi:hypothetical protein